MHAFASPIAAQPKPAEEIGNKSVETKTKRRTTKFDVIASLNSSVSLCENPKDVTNNGSRTLDCPQPYIRLPNNDLLRGKVLGTQVDPVIGEPTDPAEARSTS